MLTDIFGGAAGNTRHEDHLGKIAPLHHEQGRD
jgi:hypothetical protein